MKLHYLLLITFHLSLFTLKVSGQNKPCNNFDCAYKKAENFLKQAAYQKALDNLDSAEGYLTDTNTKEKEQIKQLRRRLFGAIEKEKEDAKRARDEAKRQTEIAKNALAQVEIEKQTAIEEKTKAQAAEALRIRVLNMLNFYDGKFGLAYDKESQNYGFIDKDLNTKINFKYVQALPFDYTGFAKVKIFGIDYLIDSTGIEYKLATEPYQLNSSITALDLRNIGLDEISPSVLFLKYEQLKILLLNINQLSSLPPEFGKLTNLISVHLSGNQLRSLPAEFGKLTNLTSLDLTDNQLSSLPIEFGKLTNLTSLGLSMNQLSSLPPEFGKLTNLTSLDLSMNQLSSLPPEFGKLTNLTSLNLSVNPLSSLSAEIGKLTNLTSLSLNSNRLSILPTEFNKLTNLASLYLIDNQLSSLPPEFEKLTNLKYLNLTNNPILKEDQEKIKKLLPNCVIEF
jgi:Leucine rich repeat